LGSRTKTPKHLQIRQLGFNECIVLSAKVAAMSGRLSALTVVIVAAVTPQ
jgi:hypothetical protein